MKLFFKLIAKTQNFLLGFSILILMLLPQVIVFYPDFIFSYTTILFSLAHFSLFLVMIIRPLADLLPKLKFIRPLVILRKGMGVFSVSIIVSFILAKLMIDPSGYLSSFITLSYWSTTNLALFAHLADISAVLLLVTSNQLSKRLLQKNWKRVQRLSYVYFYASATYVIFILHDSKVIWYSVIVTTLTLLAFFSKRRRRLTNIIPK